MVLIFLQVSFTYAQKKEIIWNEHLGKVYKTGVNPGVKIYDKEISILYNRNKKAKFLIELESPITVYKATKFQPWGFTQFPRLVAVNDSLIASVWNMSEDDVTASTKRGWSYSRDKGNTWFKDSSNYPNDKGIELSDGSQLKLISKKYKVKNIGLPKISVKYNLKTNIKGKLESNDIQFFPIKVFNDSLLSFNYIKTKKNITSKHSAPVKYFPQTVKHTYKGIYNNQLWGKVSRLKNGSLITCQYPYFYLDSTNSIKPSGIAFFRSDNNGETWFQIGKIDFQIDKVFDGDNFKERGVFGFTEPTFQVIENKIICVMRSAPTYKEAPMYISISNDLGETWSTPKVLTNNGVLPQLLLLNNGVLVMSYGRPGVQIRFANTKDEELVWSDPIEMLRFKGFKGQVSCGYTGMLPLSDNEFLITYSDFRSRDGTGNLRKSILVRKIKIDTL